jgi:hypothetical protein
MRGALVALDGVVALTALGGGLALATRLEGDRFPVELLAGTPFHDYVVPGLILAGAVGGSATVAMAATLHSPRAGGLASMLAGLILMGWIAGEVRLLPQAARSGLEAGYFIAGLAMTALGLRIGPAVPGLSFRRGAGDRPPAARSESGSR